MRYVEHIHSGHREVKAGEAVIFCGTATGLVREGGYGKFTGHTTGLILGGYANCSGNSTFVLNGGTVYCKGSSFGRVIAGKGYFTESARGVILTSQRGL